MRARAAMLLGVFGAALVVGVLLFVLVDPGVQTIGADELVRRRADARAYFTLDFIFVVVYGVAGPLAMWRFGRTLGPEDARVPPWVALGVVALVLGGAFDAVENALLLGASSSGSASTVRLAHLLAIPKYAFGGIGFLLSVRAVALAARSLIARRPG